MTKNAWVQGLTNFAWFLYLIVLATFLLDSAVSNLTDGPTVFDVVDVPLAAAALVGVFGFFSRLPMLRPAFWRAFLPALLLWDITYHLLLAELLDLAQRSVERPVWDLLIIQVALPAPMYAALFLYGYRSSAVWGRLAEPRLVIPFAFKTSAERWYAIALWGALVPFLAVWNVLAMPHMADFGLTQMLAIALPMGLAAGIVLVAPLDILILTFIARLRPQDFAVDCQVCAYTTGFHLRWPRSLRHCLSGGWICRGCGTELDRRGHLRT